MSSYVGSTHPDRLGLLKVISRVKFLNLGSAIGHWFPPIYAINVHIWVSKMGI